MMTEFKFSNLNVHETKTGFLFVFFLPKKEFLRIFFSRAGDWDLFLGLLEWARAETGGADRWVL